MDRAEEALEERVERERERGENKSKHEMKMIPESSRRCKINRQMSWGRAMVARTASSTTANVVVLTRRSSDGAVHPSLLLITVAVSYAVLTMTAGAWQAWPAQARWKRRQVNCPPLDWSIAAANKSTLAQCVGTMGGPVSRT